jgi:hypothetical protein
MKPFRARVITLYVDLSVRIVWSLVLAMTVGCTNIDPSHDRLHRFAALGLGESGRPG